jgi:hypothetical protein
MHHCLLGDYPPSWSTNLVRGVHMVDAQLASLSACLGDEIMGSTRIKQNDSKISV